MLTSRSAATAAPTGDQPLSGRDDRDSTARHGLPMPGLSGNANGPIGELPRRVRRLSPAGRVQQQSGLTQTGQVTSSRAPSTTPGASKTRRYWSGSSSILRLRYTPQLGSVVTLWWGYIDTEFGDEVWLGDKVRAGYKAIVQGIALYHPSGRGHDSAVVASIVLHVWASGPRGFLLATFRCLAFTLV
ncbi:hypothetical protein GGS23DRAFT_152694 [Durotheca rogersii]|uniref:uncharacterized protein n=1 Tax=Durotheca rogersii TaxID=419775 RepID=UPI00221F0AD2|nr:uncharacterized protein GGS23DRAFT_152694 [Durotheca rogersii]KAI5861120.1 hypothetical protein GGS23DRAFT_152694 [Durotheca rogersii]